jgi:hypothetical protein
MTTKLKGWAGLVLGDCRHKSNPSPWAGHIVCTCCGLLHSVAGVKTKSMPIKCPCGYGFDIDSCGNNAMLCSACCKDMSPMMHVESIKTLLDSKSEFTRRTEKMVRIAVAATSLLAMKNTGKDLGAGDANRLWDMIAENALDLESLGVSVLVPDRLPD